MMKSLMFLILFCAFSFSESYKILALFPMPMHSHYVLASRILKELAQRGHDITVITPFLQKTPPIKNFHEISVESLKNFFEERKQQLYGLEQQNFIKNVQFFNSMGLALTEKTLQHENVQKLLKSKQEFDLVIVAQFINEGLLGIAKHFNAPYVLMSTMPLFPWVNFLLAHPTPPSYTPVLLSPHTSRMDFWQRARNTLYDAFAITYHQFLILPQHRELIRKYIPGNLDLYEFLNNASMVLVHSDKSVYNAKPNVPNAVEIGGAHISTPQPLSADLKEYLDNSKNGVVLFSMGSNLKSSDFPKKALKEVLNTFSNLSHNILWKWESDHLPNQPKNVKLMKWLPQSDVLAHPNVKGFITHGGLLSTIESIYNGIPLVGIPIFADQKMNMASAVSYGYAQLVPFQELSQEKLSRALDEILNNPKFKENAERRSRIMRDQPIKPLDNAIFCIEYVARHQGAPHLRYAGMDLTWYQRNLLDVFAFFLLVILIAIFSIVFLIKCIFKKNTAIANTKKTN